MVILTTLEKGDIILADFSPTQGHEQSGIRPALVISEHEFNSKNFVVLCPITSKSKKNPFEVVVTDDLIDNRHGIIGVILCDQFKTVDKNQRIAKVLGKVDDDCLARVMEKISLILGV